MSRIRVTQILPFLLPLRIKQKKFCFYYKMKHDNNNYAIDQDNLEEKHLIIKNTSTLINKDSGYDIQYQYNKVHNLELAALTLDNLQIKPGETFSFWHAVKKSYQLGEYKEGLMLVDNKIVTTDAGGLCQISQLLYWSFVHTDLTIIENYSHSSQAFYVNNNTIPLGMESTVSEGWQDLQVKNNTDKTYQIKIDFDEKNMYLALFCNYKDNYKYQVIERDNYYCTEQNKDYYHNMIFKQKYINEQLVDEELLKENKILLKFDYREYLNKEE